MLISKTERAFDSLADLLASARTKLANFSKHNDDDIFPDAQGLGFMYLHIAALVLSFVAWAAVLFVGRDLKLFVIAAAVVTSGLTWFLGKVEKRKRAAGNEGAEIGLGAFVQGFQEIYEPDEDGKDETPYACFVVVTRDEAFEKDPDRLIDVADRLGELRKVPVDQVPADLREVRTFLDDEGLADFTQWYRLPRSFSAGDPTWLTTVIFFRDRLPHRCVDRPLWPVLYHRDHSRGIATSTLAPEFWWSEQNDDLFFASEDSSAEQDVG